ncbi:MAG TPA: MFS transporter [Streptosporangiaceae bacterium]|jgi:CP family cyanate transporter-like MFS transporter
MISRAVPRRIWPVALIVLVALNLRPAITAVGPLLTQIRDDLHLSGAAAGALTTLPLLFFGSFGLIAPFVRRSGEWLLVSSMGVLVVALLVRAIPNEVALFAGSLLAGIGISVGNVAVPGIIKRDHPHSITLVTSVYTIAVSGGAAIAAGTAVPVADALGHGWRLPLVLLAVPALLAGLAWVPRTRGAPARTPPADAPLGIWRHPLAWAVTAFMGTQSLLAYVVFAWLPTIYQDRGMDEAAAGYLLAASAVMQVMGALAVPIIERRLPDQRPLVLITTAFVLVGFAGVAWAPIGTALLWTVILGLGQGAVFAMALSFIGLRAADSHVATRLSGMSQGVGYAIAALGPLGIGAVHDLTGSWTVPAIILLVITFLMAVPGVAAGRTGTVGAEPEPVGGSGHPR